MWKISPQKLKLRRELTTQLHLDPLTTGLLINRDIITPEAIDFFLRGTLDDLASGHLFVDMDKALRRIDRAIENGEKVLIFGDYDTDGVTAAAYLHLILRDIGAVSSVRLPCRFTDGYGLNENVIRSAKKESAGVIITVDTGISALKEIKLASKMGMDVIVTDHHQLSAVGAPDCLAVINPQDKRNKYPDKDLTGAGVAYTLGRLLLARYGLETTRHFELVALGTISDVAVRKGENRVICREGLEAIRRSENVGLRALANISGRPLEKVTERDIGFGLGPRINAAGRMQNPHLALELLIENDPKTAEVLACKLDELNKKRQKVGRDMFRQAQRRIAEQVNFAHEKILVLADETWHRGVTGIVASKISRIYNRPAIIIALEGDRGVGSARTAGDYHLYKAMVSARATLEDFGGHPGACGFTLLRENISAFRERINAFASNGEGSSALLKDTIVDMALSLTDVNEVFIDELELFKPFGLGNPEPLFLVSGLLVKTPSKVCGFGRQSFWAVENDVTTEVIIPKRMGGVTEGDKIDALCSLRVKRQGGIKTWKLICQDMHLLNEKPSIPTQTLLSH